MTPCVCAIDPLADTRWNDLVERHPQATVFHSPQWLEALRSTYGYEPFVLTTSGRGPIENGLVVCRVSTRWSRRLVSLPFSDHCDPLVDAPDDLSAMLGILENEVETKHWRSFELRPRRAALGGLLESSRFCLHTLDLTRPAAGIFEGFHASSTRRAVRRAMREGLTYEAGTSDRLLGSFYALLRLTRRRHGVPPQPIAWFRNLVRIMRDGLAIHVASHGRTPVAAILTLTFRNTMVYKYGGSDAARHRLGGMPFLFWRAIQEAQARGMEALDLGRSDFDQPGLMAFKGHLGATASTLSYYTYPAMRRLAPHRRGLLAGAGRRVVGYLPDPFLDLAGRLLYKHHG